MSSIMGQTILDSGPPRLRQVEQVEAGGKAGMEVFGRSLALCPANICSKGPGASEAHGGRKAGLWVRQELK